MAATRLVSLDVFRGATMAGMVIVNNPGDWSNVYWPLLHAEWNGWTPTDLIFPFFLFIVGVSITLSKRSTSAASILKRGAIIFGVGLFLAGYPRFDVTHWRIPGVLQRIAICYTIAALTYQWLRFGSRFRSASRTTQAGVIALAAAVLTLGYWAIMMLVPVPGGTAGNLTPDGNLAAYIDRLLLTGHIYRPTFDPEGPLSTIPAVATTLLGIITGLWMGSDELPSRKAAGLLVGGVVGIVIGEVWNLAFPINKNLWTSSYVWFTAGGAAFLLGICYWVIDVRGWRGWTKPFVILGVNALALFAFSALLVKTLLRITITFDDGTSMTAWKWLYVTAFQPYAPPKVASLMFAIVNLVVLFFVLWWMYRRQIFLKA
jgi:predicted acyltransferase